MPLRAPHAFASLLFATLPAWPAVTRIDLIRRQPAPSAYQYLSAKIHFAVDPQLPANRTIADLALAPRNLQGKVEFAADLEILRPADPHASNGTALVEISNRGGKSLLYEFNLASSPFHLENSTSFGDALLLKQGFTLVWVGWEFDVPPSPGLLRAYLPVATEQGQPITGWVRSEWSGEDQVNTIPLGDKGQIGYPALDPDSPRNQLYVRDAITGPRTLVPHSAWKFADPTHVSLKEGFTPGRLYEVVYQTQDPPVAGLGLAAVRDFVAYLKSGTEAGSGLHLAHSVQRSIAFGVSQSGRFLREFLYDGFNSDESGNRVFDGVWAHVAGAGRGSFNQRFAQPSRDGQEFNNVFYPVDLPPFDEQSLLQTSQQTHTAPKLFLTNGSYEYWSRCASLIHTTPDGQSDTLPPPDTRIYFFSGSQHTVGAIPPRPAPTQNATNVNDYRYALRALLVALNAWITNGTEPPASQVPLLARTELTTLAGLHFPHIPGINLPPAKREAYRLDFSSQPPKVSPPFPTFIPQVDASGNELGGIAMPEVAVPLASYTGWNLRSPAIGAPTQLLPFVGSTIPFALTQAERLTHHDPRLSLAERYPAKQTYLDQIDAAARRLASARLLLESDLGAIHQRAAQEWNFYQQLPQPHAAK